MPSLRQPNYLYRNAGELRFESVAEAWGLGERGFSNGAVYADLDRDGDLDLVVNNLNAPASLYRNQSREQDSLHYLDLRLEGKGGNPQALGAKVTAWADGQRQYLEHYPVRGFQSCMEPGRLHLGLGQAQWVDSLRVIWPDGRLSWRRNLRSNQVLTLTQDAAAPAVSPDRSRKKPPPRFANRTEALGLDGRHEENDFVDFNREPLLPHRLSTQGPRPAVGDVNGDGREDLYLPGAAGQAGQLLLQGAGGSFRPHQSEEWARFAAAEEVAACFLDVDGDGDLDLYTAYGGHQFAEDDPRLQDRMFLNRQGTFVDASDRLPIFLVNTGCVTPADYDGDGDVDLFVGGRSQTGRYGLTPPSYLLRNEGGRFSDATASAAPALRTLGMVTDAQWLDYDGDGDLDLAVVGEWMPPVLLRQEQGRLERDTVAIPPQSHGWWNRLLATDLDGDGDPDLVAGNLGLNSTLQARAAEPCRLYVADFDGNGDTDPILCYYREGKSYPWATRDELLKQLVGLRRRFPDYQSYAQATVQDLFSPGQLAQAERKVVHTFAHAWFENRGGRFLRHELPRRTQVAPVYALWAHDVDQDGQQDLLLGGNFYGVGPNRGRYDASRGFWLRGKEQGRWQVQPGWQCGFDPEGELRDLQPLRIDGRRYLLASRNDSSVQIYAWR